MSTTFYDSPDDKWVPYAGGPNYYDRLSIDVTYESVWFFGDREDGTDQVICIPIAELPTIAKAINEFLAFTEGTKL